MSSRARPEVLGRGGADHGADVAEPGPRGAAGLAELRDQACDARPHGPSLGERRVLEVGGAGVGRAHEDEDAGARRAGGTGEHLHGVAAQVGACRERVGSQPLDGAERRRGRPDERLPVGGRRHVDVAALGVGEHEQPGRSRVGDHVGERGPPGRAEALEAGDLRLDGHARGPGGVDDRAAVRGDGAAARPLRGGRRAGRARRRPRRPRRATAAWGRGPGRGRPGTRADRRARPDGPRSTAAGTTRRSRRPPGQRAPGASATRGRERRPTVGT